MKVGDIGLRQIRSRKRVQRVSFDVTSSSPVDQETLLSDDKDYHSKIFDSNKSPSYNKTNSEEEAEEDPGMY